MYESPIAIIQNEIKKQFENDVYNLVWNYGIDVNKEELLRALKYDRGQYDKGHLDGYFDAMKSIVHCKECKYNVANMDRDPLDETDYTDVVCSYWMSDGLDEQNDFCSKGVKK